MEYLDDLNEIDDEFIVDEDDYEFPDVSDEDFANYQSLLLDNLN